MIPQWQWKIGPDLVTVEGCSAAEVVRHLREASLGGSQQTDAQWMADVITRAGELGVDIGPCRTPSQFVRRMVELGVLTMMGRK